MDNRKTLKPELKEIYERVMNTHTPPRPGSPSPAQSSAPKPTTPPAAHLTQPPAPKPAASPISMPPSGASAPSTAKGFVFHGNAKSSHHEKSAPAHREHAASAVHGEAYKPKGMVNGKIVTLAVIFIFIWTMFWLIYFGLVDSSTFGL